MVANPKVLLLDQLRQSGLLQPAQLEALARLPEAEDPEPRALARQVLQRRWLTRFQITQIVQGRAKDLQIGPYRVLDRLGEGGMGQVFKAQHQHMSRVVALKVIRKDRLSNPKAVARFYQEVKAAGQLHHPNIVMAFDAGEAVGGTHFLSMEYVEGQDLAQVIRDVGPLPVWQACDYIRQAALGLQHAHKRGLVHRDIKPSNLLVTTVPPEDRTVDDNGPTWGTVKVLDMGLARLSQELSEEERSLTRDGAILGTPDFQAPEQALAAHSADGRADLYSLGCTLFYLLTARTPFYAESVAQLLLKHQIEEAIPLESLRSDVPAGVRDVIARLLAKQPEDRMQTAADLAAALEPFCRAETAAAPAVRPPAPAREMSWATIAAGDEATPPLAKKPAAEDDRTLPDGEDEAPVRPKKGGRGKARKGKREAAAANRKGLVYALVGAGVLVPLLVAGAVGGLLWLRPGQAKPPVVPPGPQAHVEGGNGDNGGQGVQQSPPTNRGPVQSAPGAVGAAPSVSGELRRLEPIKAPVLGLTFSPDGKRVAGTDGTSAYLWETATGRLERRLARSPVLAQAAAFTPDGRRLYLGGQGQFLQLWDAQEGRWLRDFPGHTGTIRAVAVSPDGGRVLTAAGDFEVQDGKPVLKDGRPVCRDCTVRVWDPVGGRELCRFEGHQDPVLQVTLSADGRRALSRSQLRLCLWETDGGREIRALGEAVRLSGDATSAVLCPDGRHALLGSASQGLRLWDVDADQEGGRFEGFAGRVTAVAVSADGSRALSGSHVYDSNADPKVRECCVRLWDVATGRPLRRFDGHTASLGSVAFAADGRLAASCGLDRTVRLWDLAKAAGAP